MSVKQHVPYIEEYINQKRYGGNYYTVFFRDNCSCVLCGSTENLCVHHIDGYAENAPECSAPNRLLTLCRSRHIRVHRCGLQISNELLSGIGYMAGGRGNVC